MSLHVADRPAGMVSIPEGSFSRVAQGVERLATVFVNLYTVDLPGGGWMLVDTGIPRFAWYVKRAVESRYGTGAKPLAIVLTHGHFDHAGNAKELALEWGVPVFAYRLELPYLTGRSDYAPQDPTPGGAICFLSRFFPKSGIDVGVHVRVLPEDGSIPLMPGWRWIHTPGHTQGHISLFREADRVLIAGDVIATTNLDAWSSQFTWPREISGPPTPFTPDWHQARASITRVAKLNPTIVAAGHGLPIDGANLGASLASFAETFQIPAKGRYTHEPARYAEDGSLAQVPRAVPDPIPRNLLVGAAVAGLAVGLVAVLTSYRKPKPSRWLAQRGVQANRADRLPTGRSMQIDID